MVIRFPDVDKNFPWTKPTFYNIPFGEAVSVLSMTGNQCTLRYQRCSRRSLHESASRVCHSGRWWCETVGHRWLSVVQKRRRDVWVHSSLEYVSQCCLCWWEVTQLCFESTRATHPVPSRNSPTIFGFPDCSVIIYI